MGDCRAILLKSPQMGCYEKPDTTLAGLAREASGGSLVRHRGCPQFLHQSVTQLALGKQWELRTTRPSLSSQFPPALGDCSQLSLARSKGLSAKRRKVDRLPGTRGLGRTHRGEGELKHEGLGESWACGLVPWRQSQEMSVWGFLCAVLGLNPRPRAC